MTSDNEFLQWLSERRTEREQVSLSALVGEQPSRLAIVVVDLVEGFCRLGPLASPRVAALIDPIVNLLKQAEQLGVTRVYLPCDSHPADSREFQAFPPHCVEGTKESELVAEIRALPAFQRYQRINKRSVCSKTGTQLLDLLRESPLDTILCVGDCTDLCLYQLATGLRFSANAEDLGWRVVVAQNLVATYDLSLSAAQSLGALPHPGEFLDKVFLYHLELNGVQVVELDAESTGA